MKLRKSPRKAALLAQLPGKIFFPSHLKSNQRTGFNYSRNSCCQRYRHQIVVGNVFIKLQSCYFNYFVIRK